MLVEQADRRIVDWAVRNSTPFYYVSDEDLPTPCLKVHCGQVTGYFHQGQLVRVRACAESTHFEDMMREMATLMALSDSAPFAGEVLPTERQFTLLPFGFNDPALG